MNQLVLSWPDKGLSPNARLHHHAKAKLTKLARESAYWLTKQAWIATPEGDAEIMIHLDFHPPDKRRRDLDGMLASAKAQIDGMADALEVNDYRFAYTIRRREPVKGGKVVVWIDRFDIPLASQP
jgi:crossover junction endodeoxyribonuclease RusA